MVDFRHAFLIHLFFQIMICQSKSLTIADLLLLGLLMLHHSHGHVPQGPRVGGGQAQVGYSGS